MGPAVPAGDYPGFPEMIPGGFADNNTLGRARGAGEPYHVPGSRTPYIGKGNLMFHGIDTQRLLDPFVRRIATGSPDQKRSCRRRDGRGRALGHWTPGIHSSKPFMTILFLAFMAHSMIGRVKVSLPGASHPAMLSREASGIIPLWSASRTPVDTFRTQESNSNKKHRSVQSGHRQGYRAFLSAGHWLKQVSPQIQGR